MTVELAAMVTHPTYDETARILPDRFLAHQRRTVYAMLKELQRSSPTRMPSVLAWKGHEDSLWELLDALEAECRERGMGPMIPFSRKTGPRPGWTLDPLVHRACRGVVARNTAPHRLREKKNAALSLALKAPPPNWAEIAKAHVEEAR